MMLHYYDIIGLLKPENISEAGYRLYPECVVRAKLATMNVIMKLEKGGINK